MPMDHFTSIKQIFESKNFVLYLLTIFVKKEKHESISDGYQDTAIQWNSERQRRQLGQSLMYSMWYLIEQTWFLK